ncbi:MAG: ABC transporter substrate-binding protein [Brevinema sp.]
MLNFKSILLFFVLFTGCQSNDGKTVYMWHYFSSSDGVVFQKYIDEFNNTQNNIFIQAEFVPREELLKQYSLGIVGGDLPDIGMIDNPDHAAFSASGIFEDITDRFNEWGKDKFLPGPLNSVMYEGKIYGVPQASLPLALYYNKKMFEEVGATVPQTWQELRQVAKKLTLPNRYGIAMAFVKNEEGTFQYTPWMLSSGAEILDTESNKGIQSLDFIYELICDGSLSRESLVWGQGDIEKLFSSRRVAMMVNGPWMLSSIRDALPQEEWGVALLPYHERRATTLGGENFTILKGKKVDESWEFFKWFLDKDISEKYNREINKFSPRSDVDSQLIWIDDPEMQAFAEQMKYAYPRGPHPKWPEISTALIGSLHETVSGQKTSQQAYQDFQQIVKELK